VLRGPLPPSTGKKLQSVATLCNGEVAKVIERLRICGGKGAFLRLADGRGWVLDFVEGSQTLQRLDSPRASLLTSLTTPLAAAFEEGATATERELLEHDEDKEGGPETETGDWRYVVVDPRGITLRSLPTSGKSAKIKTRLEEGQVVQVVERHSSEGVQYLRVEDPAGWAFDRRCGPSGGCLRMMEAVIECGEWCYRIAGNCARYSRCSTTSSAKIGPSLEKGALINVRQRLQVRGATYLKSEDGASWICQRSASDSCVEGPLKVQDMYDLGATVIPNEIFLMKYPTSEASARTKMCVLNGSLLNVTTMVHTSEGRWAFVEQKRSNGSGLKGWAPAGTLDMNDVMRDQVPWAAC